MALSEMSSREKTIIVVLGVVIVIALVGIGILAARLITGDDGGGSDLVGTAVPTTADVAGGGAAGATITPVDAPSLDETAGAPPETVGGQGSGQPIVVVRTESPGNLLPALLTDYPLYAGHVYRVEVSAIDGSSVAINGSWSQAAVDAAGQISTPLPELFEGTTPFNVDITSPLAAPTSWRLSVSASASDLLGQSPVLVLTVYDVTGSQ